MTSSDKPLARYPIPAIGPEEAHVTKLLVRKSRFLTSACHCPTSASAKEFINLIKARYPDASHNCWAYVAGAPGSTAAIGSSDDGEPHGTAGRPMLKALLAQGPGEICAVTSRWFGGIKLGTGGLVRAYQEAVLENLASLPLGVKLNSSRWQATLDYGVVDAFRRQLPDIDGKIEKEVFTDKTTLVVTVPEDRLGHFRAIAEKLGPGLVRLSPL